MSKIVFNNKIVTRERVLELKIRWKTLLIALFPALIFEGEWLEGITIG